MKYVSFVLFFALFALFTANNAIYCQETANEDNVNPNIESQDLLPSQSAPTAKEAPSLSDIADKITVAVEGSSVTIDHLLGLAIVVTNQSASPVLVNADLAEVTFSQGKTGSVDLPSFEKAELPPTGFKAQLKRDLRDTVTAAVTVGAVQTIQGFKTQRAPILKRYGVDEERRQNEIIRFGKRLLWPGDTSHGVIYFKTTTPMSGGLLEMPISLPFGKDKDITEKISTTITK
jgi:hypothetical protein